MRDFKDFLIWRILLFLGLSLSFVSYGETKTFLAQDVQSIKINGIKIKALFKHTNSKDFQIEWSNVFSVKTSRGVLEVKDSSYKSKSSWKLSNLFSKKEIVLKVKGPSRPITIFSSHFEGDFIKWESPVFISSHQSKISGSKNKSSWNLFSKKSMINLKWHEGSISFKGFSLNAVLKDLSKTNSHFHFNDGLLKVMEGSGKIFFTTDKAKIEIKKFKGDLVGTTRSGPVNVTIKTNEIIDVFSQEGDMRFHFQETGPRFFAYTEKGKIHAPGHMNKEYSGKSLKVTGRIQGKRQGKVSLKTDTGNIYIY